MKIMELNAVPYGSTGKIAQNIAKVATESGHEAFFICGWTKGRKKSVNDHNIVATNFLSKLYHLIISKAFGSDGYGSYFMTKKIIKWISIIDPDIIHFHLMHDGFLNLPLLIKYVKTNNIPVCWTFHDCWAFTGGCPYFTQSECNCWKDGCNECCNTKYSKKASSNWKRKKEMFSGLNSVYIVTPSEWLAELSKQSMFQDYNIKVINNGIDLNVFKPKVSNFRSDYKCQNKYIVLGVAFDWGERKGLDYFIHLSKSLSENYQIVLVGTDKKIEKSLPENIISIHKTKDQNELAEIYSQADVLLNPTREDNFPTVNIEALACGTPVITFNTGGSPEIIDSKCGIVIENRSVENIKKAIIKVCEEKAFSTEDCVKRASKYNEKEKFKQYIDLFLSMVSGDR